MKKEMPHAELRRQQKALALGCAKRGKIKVKKVVSVTNWKPQKAIAILRLLVEDGILRPDPLNSNKFFIK
jgi:hypothetical protein